VKWMWTCTGRETSVMTPREFIEYLRRRGDYRQQIAYIEHIPARAARFATLSRPLPAALQRALHKAAAENLYLHQAQAINAIREGQHVMVATSTASGKTLVYNTPVLESIMMDSRSRAFYLFPTKALAQDQLRSLRELSRHALRSLRFGTYDGDTPRGSRRRLRQSASIILTNPDMLHMGILPNHSLWSKTLANLKYIVIDEAHVYRGIFGSQVACVLRRLIRLCRFYGSNPQFIFCSATIANPAQHAKRLTNVSTTVIQEDGSPQAAREFVFWNPPFVDVARTARRSANIEATALFVEMVRQRIRNITFTKARKVAELILLYAQDFLAKDAPELAPLIRSYRAGYRPELRREIEHALFSGQLLGVTATNALELGVDVGHLDATVLVGYPGTIASTWQQAGRAGRGVREALNVLIGLDNPLDQYFMRHPQALFGRSPENALIAPDNSYVLLRHLPCAAYERPLTQEDEELFGPGFAEAMVQLERGLVLEYRNDRWFFHGIGYPAEGVSLRSISAGKFALLDESQNYQLMEELEETTALRRVYPGAIYLHQGESYLITHLDLDMGIAYASPVDVDYYTEPREVNEVNILQTWQRKSMPVSNACLGQLGVTQQVIGYRRLQQFSDTVLSIEPLEMPSQSFTTMGLWFDVPSDIIREVKRQGLDLAGGLHAVEHAAIGILPLFAMCDRMDIAGLSTPSHVETGRAQVFIYDALPGGVGITEKGFDLLTELWKAALTAISECPCQEGCPSCVQSPRCGNNNEPLDKRAAILILQLLLDKQRASR
jgi:DEAD/DEAH box helicase domain-containing protein